MSARLELRLTVSKAISRSRHPGARSVGSGIRAPNAAIRWLRLSGRRQCSGRRGRLSLAVEPDGQAIRARSCPTSSSLAGASPAPPPRCRSPKEGRSVDADRETRHRRHGLRLDARRRAAIGTRSRRVAARARGRHDLADAWTSGSGVTCTIAVTAICGSRATRPRSRSSATWSQRQRAEGLDLELPRRRMPPCGGVAPAISEHVLAASFCPSDGHADPVKTTQAFAEAAQGARARDPRRRRGRGHPRRARTSRRRRDERGLRGGGLRVVAAGSTRRRFLRRSGSICRCGSRSCMCCRREPLPRTARSGLRRRQRRLRRPSGSRWALRFTTGSRALPGDAERGAIRRSRRAEAEIQSSSGARRPSAARARRTRRRVAPGAASSI